MKSTQAFRSSDKMEIYYSPLAVLAATTLFIFFEGWMVYWIVLAFSGHIVFVLIGLLAAAAAGIVLLSYLPTIIHGWRHKGPVITFDLDGATDARKENSFVPWAEIRGIAIGRGSQAFYLCFQLRQPNQPQEDAPRLGLPGTIFKRVLTVGDWNINLRLLACDNRKLLASARKFRQLHIRCHVVESVAWYSHNKNDAHLSLAPLVEPNKLGCPRDNSTLIVHTGRLPVSHRCNQCSGLWLPASTVADILNRVTLPYLITDSGKSTPLRCPDDQAPLLAVYHHGAELDICSKCSGVWFDHGELELIKERKQTRGRSQAVENTPIDRGSVIDPLEYLQPLFEFVFKILT